MTSFTKALYRRDPKAAEAFYTHQQFETRLQYGKHVTLAQFTPAYHEVKRTFGKRLPSATFACAANCGHPACRHGCTLIGQMG